MVNKEAKNEVFLSLNLLNMGHLANRITSINLVIHLHTNSMRAYPKLAQENTKTVHPKAECVMGPNNEPVTHPSDP